MSEFSEERTKYIINDLASRICLREENFDLLTTEEKEISLREVFDFILRNFDYINKHFPKKFHDVVYMKMHAARKLDMLTDEKYDIILSSW